MKFDNQKNDLILNLRKLKKLKNDKPYIELKRSIMEKYNVTERTVQLWLNRKSPGLRKSRRDAGKDRVRVLPLETRIVTELLETGVDIAEIKKVVKSKTGKEISDRKLNKIRDRIEGNDKPVSTNKKSNFGDKAKDLFVKLFELNLIAPENGISLKVGKESIIVSKEDVSDICLILSNAYNRFQESDKKKKKVDRTLIRKQMILHLIEQQVRLAQESGTTQDVLRLTTMHDKMTEKFVRDANIRVLEKICKHFKPDIQFDEIVSLIDEYTEEI